MRCTSVSSSRKQSLALEWHSNTIWFGCELKQYQKIIAVLLAANMMSTSWCSLQSRSCWWKESSVFQAVRHSNTSKKHWHLHLLVVKAQWGQALQWKPAQFIKKLSWFAACIRHCSSPLTLIWADQLHCEPCPKTVLWFPILRAGISFSEEPQGGRAVGAPCRQENGSNETHCSTVGQKWARHASSELHSRHFISPLSLTGSPRSVQLFVRQPLLAQHHVAGNTMWAAQVLGLTAASSSWPSGSHSDSLEMFHTTSQVTQLWQSPNSCWTLQGSWIKKNILGWNTKGSKLTTACCTSLKRNFGEMRPCDAAVNTQGHYYKCWQSCFIFQARLQILPQGYILRRLVCFINSAWFIYLLLGIFV